MTFYENSFIKLKNRPFFISLTTNSERKGSNKAVAENVFEKLFVLLYKGKVHTLSVEGVQLQKSPESSSGQWCK